MTEEQAIGLLQKGKTDGLEWLMEQYMPYVSAVVWNVIGPYMSRADAEEVVSDVFLALWQHGDRLRTDHMKSYIAVTARNKAINKLRDRGVTLEADEDTLSIPDNDPASIVQAQERDRRVQQAVSALDMPDREIFVRFYYYGQSAADIARRVNMTPAAVRQRLKRGRDRLREEFMEGELLHGV
jgi:RNA polymerase sigma-70 factor (ECF subfamily)